MRLYEFTDSRQDDKSLYVSRKLQEPEKLMEWAKAQGFEDVLDPDEFHVTVAYSTKAVDWDRTTPLSDTIRVVGGARSLKKFGKDNDVAVLCFENETLSERWQEFIDELGCTWSHDGYHAHVTISYAAQDIDIDDMTPFDGELVFGPETFGEVDLNYKDKLKTS